MDLSFCSWQYKDNFNSATFVMIRTLPDKATSIHYDKNASIMILLYNYLHILIHSYVRLDSPKIIDSYLTLDWIHKISRNWISYVTLDHTLYSNKYSQEHILIIILCLEHAHIAWECANQSLFIIILLYTWWIGLLYKIDLKRSTNHF